MKNLEFTYKELEKLTSDNLEGFTVLYNAIPKEGNPNNYIEDDGRQLRFLEFKELNTNNYYSFSYVWHQTYETIFPSALLDHSDNIVIVEKSTLSKNKITKNKTQDNDAKIHKSKNDLWEEYLKIENEAKPFSELKNTVPVSAFDDAYALLKSEHFTVNDIRAAVLPICIRYKVEQKSTWAYIQKTRGSWK